MKKLLTILVILVLAAAIYFLKYKSGVSFTNPTFRKVQQEEPKPLAKYTIEALSKTLFKDSQITLGETLNDESDYSSQIFYFDVDPSILRQGFDGELSRTAQDSGQAKKVSGLINLPKGEGIYPVIVMFRGYIDREKYQAGTGTQRAAAVFAKNGFVTLAPDFLGYGSSDMPSENPMEERFQTYTTALTLIESVKNLNSALLAAGINIRADPLRIAIWGHSNGGQIALTILETGGEGFPTVLWAPVSKPFPYSVLYYTDDFDDHGKMLRRVVSDFEKDYDVEDHSLTNFFEKINAPIQLHQGGADEAVPIKWSDQLYEQLNKLGKDIKYFTYAGDDHDFTKGSWSTVVSRNIDFYKKQFSNNQKFP